MKKCIMALALATTLAFGSMVSYASVIPPQGPGQIGLSSVVLCDSLSLHSSPDFESATTQTMKYGDKPIVLNQSDGWAQVVLGDSEDSPSGWVSAEFIAVDPAWYKVENETPVYAWNDTSAPKVALLDAGTTLPILRDDGDWLVVSLRGAAGWISDPDRAASQNNTANTNSTETAQNKPDNGANDENQDTSNGEMTGEDYGENEDYTDANYDEN